MWRGPHALSSAVADVWLTSGRCEPTIVLVLRTMLLATLVFFLTRAACAQELSVLHIKVVLVDAEQKPAPVPRHPLLISDNPATATPRLIVTAADGTADVKLRPGNYTVESDRPAVFHGKAYQWTQTLDIVAGRDAVLELTAANAEVGPAGAADATSGAPPESDPYFLLTQWKDSLVTLWTPTAYASGFVIDAKGLIATNQRAIGTATSVEVQFTPAIKVAAKVLAADPERDVALLWIDPAVIASVRPVPLGCKQAAAPPVVNGQKLFAIGVPLGQEKDITPGTVSRVDEHTIASDFRLGRGSTGGPVFTADGGVVGITSIADDAAARDDRGHGDSRVVRIADACTVVASAETKMQQAAPPSGTHLPVEPVRPFPVDVLENAAKRRAGSLNPYQISSTDFDVAFITPVLIYGAQHQPLARPIMDFGNWSEYVADFPAVLLIRVTPKQVEGLWTKVARGAAQTQGVAIPPIKRIKSSFSRLRAFCGDAEVTPIHPFTLEQRLSESETIREGLYVFEPGALGPQCGTVKLALYSEKEPEKGETRLVDPNVLQRITQDFAIP